MEIATSPVIKKKKEDKSPDLNFVEAIQKVIDGGKIHKLEWGNKEYYGFINGEYLSLHKPDGKNYQWVIRLGDLAGTDYIVL